MTGTWWLDSAIGVAGGLLVAWLALVVTLLRANPGAGRLTESMRLLPDVVRLVRRLAVDPAQPVGVRVRLGLLLAYQLFPIDLVPDFFPGIGHADDVIVTVLVLRSVIRRAGIHAVREAWPGTEDGLAALCRLLGMNDDRDPGPDVEQRRPHHP